MDLLAGLMTGQLQASTPAPDADFWFQPVGAVTAAGMRIDAEGARKISAWYRGRDILATSLAMLPLGMFERLPDDEGRRAATRHPLHDVLHRQWNVGTDALQGKRQAVFDVIDYGWAYADMIDGPRGFVDQLMRIDPKLVTPEQVAEGPSRGRWLFHVRDAKTGQSKTKTQDEIFYLRGADGKGILDYARDSIGLGVTLETYASKLFSNGAMSGGVVTTPGPMPDDDAMGRFARQFVTKPGSWHVPKVIPFGATFAPAMMEPEKAQMILSRKFTIVDIARWLGLPAHMLGEVETAGVTGLEQRAQEFVTYSLGPWLSLWEAAINHQLVLRPEVYYAEFNRDALVRGDLAARWEAYVASVNAGIVMPDEVRVKENLPKVGGKASELRDPANITGRGAKGGPQDNQRPGRTGDGAIDPRLEQAQAITRASAARLLEKEVNAVRSMAVQNASNQDAFAEAVTNFYAERVPTIMEALVISEKAASEYCAGQAAQLLNGHWVTATELWLTEAYAAGVAELALEAA